MNEKEIWQKLRGMGYSEVATAALMGNMKAESDCVPNRIEGDFSKGYPKSEAYTSQVDAGIKSKNEFMKDSIGYGLCQWTFYTRKAGLYDLALNEGKSIGDLDLQLKFLNQELRSGEFNSVFKVLATSDSLRECSDIVCLRFECPYDSSDGVLSLRASYAREFYDQFAGTDFSSGGSGGNYNSGNSSVQDDGDDIPFCCDGDCFIKELFIDIMNLIEEKIND